MLEILIVAVGSVVLGLLLLVVAWKLLRALGWVVTKGCGCLLAVVLIAAALGLLLFLLPMLRPEGVAQ